MTMVKFSVVVPVYNVEKYIGFCIESLQKQTLKEIEIILVDDGSPDKSGEICDLYAAKDARIIVIHKKNGGVSAARNDGMDIAKGEYIIFCDSDDWLPENALEKLYNKGVEVNADIVIGNVYQSNDGKEILAKFYRDEFVTEDREFIDKMIQADFYKTYCPLPDHSGPAFGYGGPWNKAVRLSMLKKAKIKFDVRVKGIFDDIIYTAHILANAKKVAYIKDPVYYYRIIPTSITRTYKVNALEINSAIFTCWQEFVKKYDTHNMFIKPYYANVIRRFIETLPIYFFSEKNTKSLPAIFNEISFVLNSEPYKTAVKEIEIKKLSKYQRSICYMMRLSSPYGIYLLFKVKQVLKKINKCLSN